VADFIDAAVQDIDSRLQELKVEETKLMAARAALTGGTGGTTATRRGPGRPPRSAAAATPAATTTTAAAAAAPAKRRGPGRPRGRRGGNTRSAQALELVRSKPGITIPEIATAMKIEPNYLYRVMPKLTADGLVKRDGQGWSAATPAA
jgi:hypothetical protein